MGLASDYKRAGRRVTDGYYFLTGSFQPLHGNKSVSRLTGLGDGDYPGSGQQLIAVTEFRG